MSRSVKLSPHEEALLLFESTRNPVKRRRSWERSTALDPLKVSQAVEVKLRELDEKCESADRPEGYVYVISGGGLSKIGTSRDPVQRIVDIQAMCPVPLFVAGLAHGGEELERLLHRR